ncbi:hypothetical protein DM860_000079 [Cuscuta australis]|uniref:LOB domain-containing protein n=1 Tax=Cuscuta australis TaxID=267555 RepID=A0A328CVS1_9ASTE|nr:hypothetical protein DM860_000079 [Cuscuta australis]
MQKSNNNNNNNNINGATSSSSQAAAGAAAGACASCKHQRKKCTEKCVLAAYFPAEKSREFQAVHKVFGVSNVTKMVRSVREEDRQRAVESLVWEAVCRQSDPVLGSLGEYRRVLEELKLCRTGQHQFDPAAAALHIGWGGHHNNNNNNHPLHNYIHNNSRNPAVVGYNNNNVYAAGMANHHHHHHQNNFQKLRWETKNTSAAAAVLLPCQHPLDGFNQQFSHAV